MNGKPRGNSEAPMDLRQRDPLFPFLFTIVVDMLSRMVDSAFERGLVVGFVVGKDWVLVRGATWTGSVGLSICLGPA